jgi:hypothetical protein
MLLNIVTGQYDTPKSFQASHIFAHRRVEDTMQAIFGEEVEGELFSPRNGPLLLTEIEDQFETGLFAIVSNIGHFASKAEVSLWESTQPREYNIKILDQTRPICQEIALVHPKEVTWAELDGTKLKFRNDFRPRGRHLCFHYCCQLLRLAWQTGANAKSSPLMKKELGNHA